MALILFAFSDDLVYYSSEMKPYSLDLAVGLALTLAALDALASRFVPPRRGDGASPPLSLLVLVCLGVRRRGLRRDLDPRQSRSRGDTAMPPSGSRSGSAGSRAFSSSYQASQGAAQPLHDDVHLLVVRLPAHLAPAASTEPARGRRGILLEIFVNPLNLVAPIWPWVGVVLPLCSVLTGGVSLARRSWPAWAILVLPIALAMVASAMKRYPLHGRLILELVPAFFLLIAEGTERLRELGPSRAKLGLQTCRPGPAPRLSLPGVVLPGHGHPIRDGFNRAWGFTPKSVYQTFYDTPIEPMSSQEAGCRSARRRSSPTRGRRGRPWSSWRRSRRRARPVALP